MKVFVLFGLIGSIYCTGSYNPIDARRIPQDVLLQAQNVLDKKNMLYKEKSLDDFTSSITKAEGQVVAGMNYKFTVDLHSGSDIQECQFVIFYQAWTKDFQVTENKCELKHVKRQLGGQVLGGQNSADCSSQQFQTLLPEAVKAVNMMTNSLYHMTPLQMTMCTTQVVSGFMYRFNLAFQPSEKCMNDQDHITSTLLECPPNNNPERTEHYSCSVWDQSWRKPRYQTTCKLIKDIPPQILGGDGHDYCTVQRFKDFQMKHQRFYSTQEEHDKRFSIFCDNMKRARKIQETERGSAVYGATKFADLTEKDFKKYVGKKWDLNANKYMKKANIQNIAIPESFDWREQGAVTEVKNQGSCGSCWAFSTTGNIEGQWAIKKKQLISLSEQELVSCDKLDQGCEGGLPSNAYKEIQRLGGLETESQYKYDGVDEKCVFNKSDVRVYINSSVSISSNETEMAAWLFQNGPISIGINAFVMQFYMGGISHPWKLFCNPKDLDHGVLIVGYGVEGTKPYWIVKNSWGPDWGEKGYYLVYRGDGVCGLNTMCTSAVVM